MSCYHKLEIIKKELENFKSKNFEKEDIEYFTYEIEELHEQLLSDEDHELYNSVDDILCECESYYEPIHRKM